VNPSAELNLLARALRLERVAGYALLGLGGGALYGGVIGSPVAVAVGLLAGVAVALAADRFQPINSTQVACHLDRALPELEESATLLVRDQAALSGLGRAQRQRVAERLDIDRARATLPHRDLRRALQIGVPTLLLGVALLWSGKSVPGSPGQHSPSPVAPPIIRRVAVEVHPPRYTGMPIRQLDARDLEVAEGSVVKWQVEAAGPVVGGWLAGATGSQLPLQHRGGPHWVAEATASRSELFRVNLTGADSSRVQSTDFRLAVRPDRPPTVTLLEPTGRRTVAPDSLHALPLVARVEDDYGIDRLTLNLTIASGQGEAVRFRRLVLPLAVRWTGPQQPLRDRLDLRELRLGPGDELYFFLEATDRRVPTPNRGRSETFFLSVRDSATPPAADLARMALGAEPEYFRSQRQLIIDTERLLADSAGLGRSGFRSRANDLGMDQGLLRLRYGQFLGEEYQEESSDVGEVHQHDEAENATLLGATVKEKLRAAVGAMWQSELHLRTGDARGSLPHQYRALDLIKQVQQDARVYVQRVGFEPPPIEVSRIRLTGKLSGVGSRWISSHTTTHDSLSGVRAVLTLLESPGGTASDLVPALERAGRELAALAADSPGLLPVLGEIRQLGDGLRAGVPCHSCRLAVARGLWQVVPEPESRPAPQDPPPSPLETRFQALLLGGAR
jgi:hypothetical protein